MTTSNDLMNMKFSIKDLEEFLKSKASKRPDIDPYKWWYIICSWFWLGRIPFAAGTFGTLGAYPIYYFITKGSSSIEEVHTSLIYAIIFLILIAAAAIALFHRETNSIDDGRIVIDEVIGQLVALRISFSSLYDFTVASSSCTGSEAVAYTFLIAFIAFRFFDITKIFFIKSIERSFHNTFGVIADDVLAGVYAGLSIKLLLQLQSFI